MFSGEFWILRVLVERINPPVADSETSQVDPRILCELQSSRNVGNIVAGEALSSQVDLSSLEFRILLHEVVQEKVKVIR